MNKRYMLGIIIALTILLLVNSFVVSSVETDESILYVGGSQTPNYDNIQDALDAANNGDEIIIQDGIYYESLLIDKSVRLTGEHKDTVVIDGSGTGSVSYTHLRAHET